MYTTAGALTDQSFLKGLFTAFDGLNKAIYQAETGIKPEEWAANLGRALIPYQAALRNFNNILVPVCDYNSAG